MTPRTEESRAVPSGSAGLEARTVAGQTALTDAWSSSPLKLLVPRPRGASIWAYLSSFGGGLVAGDETSMSVSLGAGARCFLTTQASTKIYRNPARRPCGHRLTATLARGSLLVLAPDPVQSFADSSYAQRQEFRLEGGAGLVLLDWFCSGRAACGERWEFRSLRSRNDIFIDGERRLLDATALEASDGPLAGAHRMGRFHCVGVLVIAGDLLREEAREALAAWAAPAAPRAEVITSASAIRDGVVLRIAGESHEAVASRVYEALRFAPGLLGDDPWARKLQTTVNN